MLVILSRGNQRRVCCTRVGARPTFSIMFERHNEKSYADSGRIYGFNMTGRGDRNWRETIKGTYGVAVDSLALRAFGA